MIEGFNFDSCQERNAFAALRDMEAAPVHLFGSGSKFAAAPAGSIVIDEQGDLPDAEDIDGALAQINALLPAGAPALTADDVYVHYCEAANGSLIADRWAFLGSDTLANIAEDAAAGVAFMNSHRTGGFSAPSELPFGKTFGGKYEQRIAMSGEIFERSLVGVYLLRDLSPNGANGPTTDALHRMIDGGVLADVSVGLWPGQLGRVVCDVCRGDYRRCSHYAGTSYGMTEEEMQSQRSRGSLRGFATYTLADWRMGEVSGVYDGAVAGAGFAKGYAALRAGRLSAVHAEEFTSAYAALLRGLKG